MNYRIFPPEGYLEGQMKLPLSKSMSNRALIISALTEGVPLPDRLADCDDTTRVVQALKATALKATALKATVDAGDAGTAMRFLTAYYASQPGADVLLTGSERMRERPVGPLVDALRRLGASIQYVGEEGYPPLKIEGRRLAGGSIEVDATMSSQFISAILMVAPTMTGGLKMKLLGEPASLPYILMTLRMMDAAGAETDFYGGDTIEVAPVAYSRPTLEVEGDWSAAAFAYEIQTLAMGEMAVEELDQDSCQGDAVVADLFASLGVETSWEQPGKALLTPTPECSPRMVADLSGTPDIAQPLVVTCVVLGIPFRFTGLDTLYIKETDRVEALRLEMLKLGASLVSPVKGTLEWTGQRLPVNRLPEFDVYNDHRMAMSLAPVALSLPGIVVNDIEVVSKSFPGYWDSLADMGFLLVDSAMPEEEVKKLLGIEEE